jgi:TPP-dependent pyruvate/acetoin dehydrogenase alpha subunit
MPVNPKRQEAAAESVSAPDGFSLISNQKLLQLYATMLKCRVLDQRFSVERTRLLNGNSASSPYHSTTRHEAAVVGVLIDLVSEDTIATPPGSLTPMLIKGSSLNEIFAGLTTRNGSSPQADLSLEMAITFAKDHKASKNKKISVVLPGRDSTDRRAWKEALAQASIHSLPVIFVSWSALTTHPTDFPTITVDGSDVVAVYRVASESIAHARQGLGPTLIECKRWQGPDPVLNPILSMEKYLIRKRLFSAAIKAEILTDFRKDLDAAFETARS